MPHGDDTSRARDIGLPFSGNPGPLNAITDVDGVEVGYVTLIEGDDVRTGVTALLPRGRSGIGVPCAAGVHRLNGNGEMTGTNWIRESGALTLPVVLTGTQAIGAAHEGVLRYVERDAPAVLARREWLLPVVAETWDGYLNKLPLFSVRPNHVLAAIDDAHAGLLAEGSVGGGTGMCAFGYKAGCGTSSRVVPYAAAPNGSHTVGVFVQANYGRRASLMLGGRHVGPDLLDDNPMQDAGRVDIEGAGSIIVIVATDAPMLPIQLTAMAQRVSLGLARTGSSASHFSGDLFLAFSTDGAGAALDSSITLAADNVAEDVKHLAFVPWSKIDRFYEAVVQATEEAVDNALVAGCEMTGRDGHRVPGLPVNIVRQWFA